MKDISLMANRKAIIIADDATEIPFGQTMMYVQRNEYQGVRTVSLLRRRGFDGAFIESRAHINTELLAALNEHAEGWLVTDDTSEGDENDNTENVEPIVQEAPQRRGRRRSS